MADVLGCVVEGVSQIARAAFFHVSMMSVILTTASLGTRVALAYLLSATPLRVTGIWLSVPIGWALADAIGIGYYLKTKTA